MEDELIVRENSLTGMLTSPKATAEGNGAVQMSGEHRSALQ